MRLSEAIRLGAMMKPQAFGDYEYEVATCALGAAANALGSRGTSGCYLSVVWPFLNCAAGCPDGCNGETELSVVITHLNDDHHWTREAIADWIETVEAAQARELEAVGG